MTSKYKIIWDDLLQVKKLPSRCSGVIEISYDEFKFLSDKFYSDSKSRSFLKKGYSLNKIRNYLINKGINEKYIGESISKMNIEENEQDFFSAIRTCKKKRIGPNREENNRILFYKKDMSILARSGFNYETSKKVLDLTKKDYERFLGLL